SVVGKLPTITQPERNTASAVVRPTPPGQEPGSSAAVISAKRLTAPLGATSTIVVPVPWALEELLKLLTSTWPSVRFPIEWGTLATPYGLTSPLPGTVDTMVMTLCKFFKMLSLSAAEAKELEGKTARNA